MIDSASRLRCELFCAKPAFVELARASRWENRCNWRISTEIQELDDESFLQNRQVLFRSKAALLAGLILFSIVPSIAQQAPPAKKRPTLGLALQGGGALGLAHVA